MTDLNSPQETISVVIPCYQQGHFLGETIESVLAQSYQPSEIIVIDDGSKDDTSAVAARYPGVRYLLQDHSGPAVARNRGISESTGNFLVFLDADDRLLNDALEIGVDTLRAHPECAFVFGRCQYIEHDGSPVFIFQQPYYESDDYLAMLRGNPIWHPAAVMCRRSVFDVINGFDTSLPSCTDYELYLRVTRRWPVHCHNKVISEYRQHGANLSSNSALTLSSITRILCEQLASIEGNKQYEEACRIGLRNFQTHYYLNSYRQLRSFRRTGRHRKHALRNVMLILRLRPRMLAGSALRRLSGLVRRLRTRFTDRENTPVRHDVASVMLDSSTERDLRNQTK